MYYVYLLRHYINAVFGVFHFAACKNGTYGQDCVNNCSTNCRDNSCNHINGSCSRCIIGYTGDVCSNGIWTLFMINFHLFSLCVFCYVLVAFLAYLVRLKTVFPRIINITCICILEYEYYEFFLGIPSCI